MQLVLGDKTYVLGFVSGRALRKVLEFQKVMDFNNLGAENLDDLIQLIVDMYGKQFTINDIYDGIAANDLLKVITDHVQFIIHGTTESVNKFPKNA